MNPRITTLVALLSAAGLVFTFAGRDGVAPDAEGPRDDSASDAPKSAEARVAPGDAHGTGPAPGLGPASHQTADAYSEAVDGARGTADKPSWSGYRFRPLDGDRRAPNRHSPYSPPRRTGLENPHDRPDLVNQETRGPRVGDLPDAMRHRFRPADESRTARRYQPYSPSPRGGPAPDPRHGYGGNDTTGQEMVTMPDDAPYHFRPLDEGNRSKRWRGNYHRMSTTPAQLAGPYGNGRFGPNPG